MCTVFAHSLHLAPRVLSADRIHCLSALQVRRAYRNLISKSHPDKGGDPETFKLIHSAYEILSDKEKVRDAFQRVVTGAGQFTMQRACILPRKEPQ